MVPSELPLSDRAPRAAAAVALLSLLSAAGTLGPTDPAYADDDAFEVRTIASPGRTLAAELVDLNGDGLDDLLISFAPEGEDEGGVGVWLSRKAA